MAVSRPGSKVGEYVIDSKIGEGGFGAVYRATHPLIGKVAAVKVLAPSRRPAPHPARNCTSCESSGEPNAEITVR